MRKHSLSFSALITIALASGPVALGQIGYCPVTTQVPTGNPVATLNFDASVNNCYDPLAGGDPTHPCCSAAASINLPAGSYIVTLNGEVWSTEGYGGPAALPIAWGSGSCPSHSSANCCFLADPRVAGGGPILIDHPGGPVYVWRNDSYWGDNYGLATINFYDIAKGPRIAFSPLPFSFGRVALDGSQETLVISNEGDQDLTGSVSFAPGVSVFSIESGGGNFVLSPGQTRDVVINFMPPPTGTTFAEDLVVTSNDPVNGNQVIPVSGELYYDKQSPLNGRFGQFYYHDQDGIDEIEIDPRWVAQNIVSVPLPIIGAVQCHQAAAASFQVAFILIDSKNLDGLIETFDGLFYPRYQRGARHEPKYLSNHSWGSAIDLNAEQSPQGKNPSEDARTLWDEAFSQVGSKKTGLPGFKWGGEFKKKDGMHYEVLP